MNLNRKSVRSGPISISLTKLRLASEGEKVVEFGFPVGEDALIPCEREFWKVEDVGGDLEGHAVR